MKKVRESKFSKFLIYYFSIFIVSQFAIPTKSYALTSGPTQPEFNSFTPIGTSDMVDLASGDFNYNIPIMDVGGYPLNLAYNSGVTMDQEASWVGLGWNLSAGQIQRQLRGLPDDFNSADGAINTQKNDYVHYKNGLKNNITAGVNVGVTFPFFGIQALQGATSLNIQYNNYNGITFKPTIGISATAGQEEGVNGTVGISFTGSASEGADVSPRVGIGFTNKSKEKETTNFTKNSVGLSLGFNTRKGIENIGLSYSVDRSKSYKFLKDLAKELGITDKKFYTSSLGAGGSSSSLAFNNISFIPPAKIGYASGNFSFNAALGSEIMGPEIQGQLTGYGSYQSIAPYYTNYYQPAFGYDNTHNKRNTGVLDFNRENEVVVNAKTNILHTPVFTYDTYSIQGQGISGMFRPYKSKVTYLSNDRVVTTGSGGSLGIEIGGGNAFHGGINVKDNPSYSHTAGWMDNNKTLPFLKDTGKGNLLYENVTYRLANSGNVDPLESLYDNQFKAQKPLTFKLSGSKYNRVLDNKYASDNNSQVQSIDRTERYRRTKAIIKVTQKEAARDPMFAVNSNGKSHHTAGMKILNEDGSTYNYGESVYNTEKLEETYDVSRSSGDIRAGIVASGLKPTARSDQFYNSVGTPAYAHSFLLTSILSADYEDVDHNGPSNNDLGGFTLFRYAKTSSNFKWKIPYGKNEASYNQVLNTKRINTRGNEISGSKEIKYLDKIITKTHVAFFDVEDRTDALSAYDAANNRTPQKRLKTIRLYSLPEVTNANGTIFDPISVTNSNIKPIKTAHFEYDYLLCPGTPNSTEPSAGKLTLTKLYFTYRNSNMGEYTPYQFKYSDVNPKYNIKGFDIWGNYKFNNSSNTGLVNDILPNATEFPYVNQNSSNILNYENLRLWDTQTKTWDRVQNLSNGNDRSKNLADQYASAWTLSKIELPSGGHINIDVESDDYAFVQDKKAMQLFDVVGAGKSGSLSSADLDNPNRLNLYNGNMHKECLWIKISNETTNFNTANFISSFLSENFGKDIQFKFLLNMTDSSYDYVGGYFKIGDENKIKVSAIPNRGTFVTIPMKLLGRESGNSGSTNPISKTGWGFARQNLNKEVFTIGGASTNDNLRSIINDLISSFASIYELLEGVNGVLEGKQCSRTFKPNKSWVRLENPDGKKLGGGLRVKSIRLSDNWKSMMSTTQGTNFDMEYGQTYNYELENKMSSGVASYEPNGSAENALVEPFFFDSNEYGAPAENNFIEKPFGENFFPSSRITYSRVSVKNLDRKNNDNSTIIVNKHATGKVVTELYTTKDFPTKVSMTPMQKETDSPSSANMALGVIQGLLPYYSQRTHITASQGFCVVTNDMDGKIKRESVFDQNDALISKVDYKYNQKAGTNELDSSFDVIDKQGKVSKKLIGLDYDMYHDFQESYSTNESTGFDGNLAVVIYGIFPLFVPIPLPKYTRFESRLNTAVTMKHVSQAGVLIEKIAYDLGATVKTKNLAWDADTGQLLLTETQNEYNDTYYSLNYPSFWNYDKMGLASENIGFEASLYKMTGSSTSSPNPYYGFVVDGSIIDVSKYLKIGDEIYTETSGIEAAGTVKTASNINTWTGQNTNTNGTKLWVVGYSPDQKGVLLMDRNGNFTNICGNNSAQNTLKIKVVRSANRNVLGANMASVTMMKNPIKVVTTTIGLLDFDALTFTNGATNNAKVINASAVTYNDFWIPQNENGFPLYPTAQPNVLPDGNVNYPFNVKVNPYVLNIKGDWRANESFAYLTSRVATANNPKNNRTEGYFKSFNPFYKLSNDAVPMWQIDRSNWTSASSITMQSPYGFEIENKDALNRYSAAQFGYNNKFPMAVASNSRYSDMGFEGFEEQPNASLSVKHFGLSEEPIIDPKQSHTGKNSIKVLKGQSAFFTRNLKFMQPEVREVSCLSLPPEGGCYLTNYSLQNTNSPCVQDITMDVFTRVVILNFSSNVLSVGVQTPNTTVEGVEIISTSRIGNQLRVCLTFNAIYAPPNNTGGNIALPVILANGFTQNILIGAYTNGGVLGGAPMRLGVQCGLSSRTNMN